MKIGFFDSKKKLHIILFWTAVSCLALFLICIAFVWLNSDKIKQTFIKELNKHLLTEVKVNEIDIGVVSSFPLVSVSFYDIFIADAFEDSTQNQDTLASLKELNLKFKLSDILTGKYNIRKIEAIEGKAKLKVLKSGDCNYRFWKSDTTTTDSDFAFSIKNITFEDLSLEYQNEISKLFVSGELSKAKASGNFSSQKQDVDIVSDINIRSFAYDKLQMQSNIPLHIDIEAQNDIEKAIATTNESIIEIGDMKFLLTGALSYKDTLSVDCSVSGKDIKLSETLSLFTNEGKEIFKGYKADGLLAFSMTAKGELTKDKMPQITANYNLENASLNYKKKKINITNINSKGSYTNGEKRNSSTSVLRMDSFSAKFNNNYIKGQFQLADFNRLYIDATLQAQAELGEIKTLLAQDSLEVLSGKAFVDLKAKGELKKLKMKGSGKLSNLSFKDKRLPMVDLTATDCEINFNNDRIVISKSKGKYFNQDFELTGSYTIGGNLAADVKLKQYRLNEILLNDIDASIIYDKDVIDCKRLNFRVFDGQVNSKSCKVLLKSDCTIAKGEARLDKINLQKTFAQTKNLNQKLLTDKNINGTLSANAKFSLYFDKDFNLKLEKSTINTDYSLNKGRLKNMQILEKLSLFVDEAALKDVKFETISSSLQIKNGVISISPINVQSNVVNFNLVGTHHLDGAIDYNISIKLSELASKRKKAAMQKQQQEFGTFENSSDNRITLFVKIKGTIDKPLFSYDLKGNMLKAKEQINKDRKEVLKAIDKDFNLQLEENRKNKEQWERQQQGEFIIEWEEPEKKESKQETKQFEDAEFSVEWD